MLTGLAKLDDRQSRFDASGYQPVFAPHGIRDDAYAGVRCTEFVATTEGPVEIEEISPLTSQGLQIGGTRPTLLSCAGLIVRFFDTISYRFLTGSGREVV